MPKKSRTCSNCGRPGHYKNHCPVLVGKPAPVKNEKLAAAMARVPPTDALDGAAALRSLVPVPFGLFIVLTGQAQEALLGALDGFVNSPGVSLSMVNAYRELIERIKRIPADQLTKARAAQVALSAAQAEYDTLVKPLADIIYKK